MTTYFRDTFTAPDGTIVPSPGYAPDVGAYETNGPGAMIISDNKCQVADTLAHWTRFDTGIPSDGYVSLRVHVDGGSIGTGVMVRSYGPGDCIRAFVHGSTVTLQQASGGGTTVATLGTATISFAPGDKIGILQVGNAVSVYYNDVEVIAPVTTTFQNARVAVGFVEVGTSDGTTLVDELDFSSDVPAVGPTTIVRDTFTDVDGTLLTAHVPEVGGASWIGTDTPAGAATIDHDGVFVPTSSWAETFYRLPRAGGYGTTDYVVKGHVVRGDISAEVYIAADLTATHYQGYTFGWYRGSGYQLRKFFTNGPESYYTLGGTTATTASDDDLEMVVLTDANGRRVLDCKVNGTSVLTFTDNGETYGPPIAAGIAGFCQQGNTSYPDNASGTYLDSFEVTTVPVGAQKLAVTRQPGGAVPGEPFSIQPVVTVQDAYGMTATGFADTVTLTKLSGPGTLSGTATVAVDTVTGAAAFSDLSLDAIGTYVFSVTSAAGLTSATTLAFTVVQPVAAFSDVFLGTDIDDAGFALLDGGATLEIRDGVQPAGPDSPATGTLGVAITLEAYGFLTFGVSGAATAIPVARATALASITPTWARLKQADGTVLMDVACGVGGVLELSAPSLVAGERVQLDTLVLQDDARVVTVATRVSGTVAVGGRMAGGVAELPRVTVESAYAAPTGATRWVGAGQTYATLEAALADAQWGDRIRIKAGTDLTPAGGAGLSLPNKAPDTAPVHRWIYIEAENLPCAEGVQVSPTLAAAANVPKIRLDNTGGAIVGANGCHHFRLVGLEVLPAAACPSNPFALVWIGPNSGQGLQGDSYADMPHHIVIDRCYLHGNASVHITHGLGMQADYMALVDSYLSEFHDDYNDCTAISSWMCKGPLKIQHNYLEALGENLLFGGAEPLWPGVCLADVELKYNTFKKDTAWLGVYGRIKTLCELKLGKRVLIEGNVFRNSWEANEGDGAGPPGWYGMTLTLKSINQYGEPRVGHIATCDVTVRYNQVDHTACAINFHPCPEVAKPVTAASRLYVAHNLYRDMGAAPADTLHSANKIVAEGAHPRATWADVLFDHNTAVSVRPFVAIGVGEDGQRKNHRQVFRNSVFACAGDLPIAGDSFGYVDANLAAYWDDNCDLARNVFSCGITSSGGPPPAGAPTSPRAANNRWQHNTTDFSFPEMHFVDAAGGDYAIAPGTTHSGYATDGSDPGCDMPALRCAISKASP